jgi:hypothetical protein
MAIVQTEEQVRYRQQANRSKVNTDSNYTHVNNIKMTNAVL